MQRFRNYLIHPIAVTLAGAMVVYLVVPQVIRAREMARMTPCNNNLFQHSGWHSDAVYLNRDLQVLYVASCPLCGRLGRPPIYEVLEDGKIEKTLDEETVPAAAKEEGRRLLEQYKQRPRYRKAWHWVDSVQAASPEPQ
jgi:hypothetical protein